MDAETFLDNFATITEAPGGIQRLRDLVLDLAVSGRLVDQDPGEDPATVGLRSVRAEKGGTLANSIRGGASTPRVPTEAECAGQPPPGWSMARLDDTGEYVNGLAFRNSDWKPAGIPIIRIQNLTNPAVPFNYAVGPFPEDRMAHDGDILVSWSATLGAFRWDRGDGVINQHIFKVIPDERVVTTDYLFHLLRHSIRAMAESDAAHGLVMKHINRGPFLSYVAAIPPLAEQVRIVARLHDLIALCDELEARQQYRHRATTQFRGSALHALTDADTPDELGYAWERVSANWLGLTDHPDSVPVLRHTILGLAVAGRLVGKSLEPCGDDGQSLLNRIRSERGKLIREGDLRGPRAAAETDRAHWPGSIPPGWTLCTLEELGALENTPITDGPFGSKLKSSHYVDYPGHRVLRLGNVRPGFLDLIDESYISAEHFASLKACHLRVDDLLVASLGNPSGRACLVTADALPAVNKADCFRVRLHPSVSPRYVSLVLNSPQSLARAAELNRGDTRGRITLGHLKATPIPLPALHVQRSIVEGVEHFLNLCNRLEAALGLRLCEQTAAASGLVRIA